jgi:amino acid transporter
MRESRRTGALAPDATSVSVGGGTERPLRPSALRLPGVLMQSLTHLAPTVSLLFSLPFIVAFAGVAAPLAFLIAFAIALMLGASLSKLAAHYPSAGGYYAYVSRTLGARAGFLTGWLYVLYSPILPAALLAFLGWTIESALRATYGVDIPWWAFLLGTAVVTAAAGYRGIVTSIRVLVVAGFFEIAIVAALAVWSIARPGIGGDNLTPFLPSHAASQTGLYLGVVFSISLYSGWEAAAPLAEESTRPRRDVPLAIVTAIVLMGAFMTLCGWGLMVGWGTRTAATMPASRELPALVIAQRLWAGAWVVVLAALANSALGVSVACNNVASRMWFAMARAGLAPRALGRVHSRFRTPFVAVLAQTTLATGVGLGLGFAFGPYSELLLVGLVTSLAVLVVYGVGNASVMRLFARQPRAFRDIPLSLVFPLVSTAAITWAVYKAVYPLPRWPADYAPMVVGSWLLLGIVLVLLPLRTRLEPFPHPNAS